MNFAKQCLFITVLLIATGCSQTVEDHLSDYSQRVASVLNEPLTDFPSIERPYQLARHNRLPIEQQSINLLEFLRLNQCELGRVIAQQNSALGKVAAPSQVMHFYRDFILSAPKCIELLQQIDPKLAEIIQQNLIQKQLHRMNVWWNAWTGFEEWQALSSTAAQPIDYLNKAPYLTISLQSLDFAIVQGTAWRKTQYQYDEKQMEEHLKQLRFSESIGRWLSSTVLLIRTLEQTAHVLEQKLKTKPLCVNRNDQANADILFNVFRKFYAGQVQPYLSRVHMFGEQMTDRLNRLSALTQPPETFSQWLKALMDMKDRLHESNRRHVHAWQATLSNCGLVPKHPDDIKLES